MKKIIYRFLLLIFFVICVGFLIPEPKQIPVQDATSKDWNSQTFWYEPWGSSGVHKGIDIFAKKGQKVIASTNLLILYRGEIKKGGQVIVGLGPKWRLHYFAHLDSVDQDAGLFIKSGSAIGKVGATGNAKGKQPHLHFSIVSIIPLLWRIDSSTQGYKKAFYLNPIEYFDQ